MVENRITRFNIRKAPIRTLERLNLRFHVMLVSNVLFSIGICIISFLLARISLISLFFARLLDYPLSPLFITGAAINPTL